MTSSEHTTSEDLRGVGIRGRKAGFSEDQIYGQIFDAIIEQRLAPDTRLAEDKLCDIFNVSRTVVRKILQRLAYEKIVQIRPNRGAAVANPSVKDAHEVFEARRAIEGAIVRTASAVISPSELESLRRIVAEEEACMTRGDRTGWIRLSNRFHLQLAETSGNETLLSFLRELLSRSSLVVARYDSTSRAIGSPATHGKLVDAMASGDDDKAAQAMAAHLDHCEAQLNLDGEEPPIDLHTVFAGVTKK
ncbi:GntR family transcriptional regulator [Pelagibius sp. Alg239-R121]|uniref:GntR family transcriptional regulator n=1 Tax=Pelagibius sp. Alg239-R121 TaxID=2993448 RepID=UPI0024A6C385|nr:GntR family transcriptional regulator [Pelagibius sp. Alg239-R121]